jgi:dienelactone hydrolase
MAGQAGFPGENTMRSRITRRGFLASTLATSCFPAALRAAHAAESNQVPWLSEVQQPPAQIPDNAARLAPLLVDGDGRPITSLEDWIQKRRQIRDWWLDFLQPLRIDRSQVPALTVVEEDRPEGVIRQLVRYEVEAGMPVEGYLLKPAKPAAGCPGVVALHSTFNPTIRQPAGVEGPPEKAFGLKLAQRGYVAFCPRNFLWPSDLEDEAARKLSYEGRVDRFRRQHPGSRGMAKMLYDAMVAVDILAGLPEVDPKRLGAVGHSLGGKETLYLAALDERIQVTVSSEGGIGTRYCNWHAPWYLGKDILSDDFGHEHHELLALVAPRAFLLLGGDASDGARSWPFVEAVLPVYRLYGGTPRVGLFNHRRGHSVPPDVESRTYEWFDTYL